MVNCLIGLSLRADKQKPCLDVPFRIFQDEGSLTDDQRRSCLERVCLPLLRASRTMGLVEFFSDHIQEILSAIEAKDIKVRFNHGVFMGWLFRFNTPKMNLFL